jgi:hypothetical protein
MHNLDVVCTDESQSNDSQDLKTLIGIELPTEQIRQLQEQELLEANSEDDVLSCYFCNKPIEPDQFINLHHPTYNSLGGTETVATHESCHVEYHRIQGDFIGWGRLSSLTRAWAWNLKNVRNHPAYDFDRQYYLALYAH